VKKKSGLWKFISCGLWYSKF